jgi:hypothetical protein
VFNPIDFGRPVLVHDCAAVAADVYTPGGGDASPFGLQELPGFRRRLFSHFTNSDWGFAGSVYKRDRNLIVSFRGTSNAGDAYDDAIMVPEGLDAKTGSNAVLQILERWEMTSNPSARARKLAGDLSWLASQPAARSLVRKYSNQIPENQAGAARELTKAAFQYGLKNGLRLVCVTGHSLGGALAQYVAVRSPIILGGFTLPGVSFNGPNMGSIRGMQSHGDRGAILIVNNYLDPLSSITRLVKSASAAPQNRSLLLHAKPIFPGPPRHLEAVYSPLNILGDPYYQWVKNAAIHYHSMGLLADWLRSEWPGQQPLDSFFPIGPHMNLKFQMPK